MRELVDNVEYALIARLKVLLASPLLVTNSSNDSMVKDPSKGNPTDKD